MKHLRILVVLLAVCLAFLVGCKKTDTTTGPTNVTSASGSYAGTFTNGTEAGVMNINIANSASLSKSGRHANLETVYSVSGTLIINGDSATISGTFDSADDSLMITATLTSGTYTFVGTYNPTDNVLTGVYTSPHGSGQFTSERSSSHKVWIYIGTFQDSVPRGTFVMAVKDSSAIRGIIYNPNNAQQHIQFTGTASGNNITLDVNTILGSVQVATGTFVSGYASASGTYSIPSTSITGTWNCTRQ